MSSIIFMSRNIMSYSNKRTFNCRFIRYAKYLNVSELLRRTYYATFNSFNVHLPKIGATQPSNIVNKYFYYKIPLPHSQQIMIQRTMAGHSKWQNIKHVKAEKDKEKSDLCNRYSRLVRAAVKEGGSDPKFNIKLSNLLAQARAKSVPLSALEGAMKKPITGKMKSGGMEILGPGGCLIILEYETDNISTTRYGLKCTLKKYNASILPGEGRWRAAYEQKGIIRVNGTNEDKPLSAENALDIAIEAGAEDVQLKTEENVPYLEFICAPNDLLTVKKELEGMQYRVEEAYIAYIPLTTTKLSSSDMQVAHALLSDLDDIEEVTRVFENIE